MQTRNFILFILISFSFLYTMWFGFSFFSGFIFEKLDLYKEKYLWLFIFAFMGIGFLWGILADFLNKLERLLYESSYKLTKSAVFNFWVISIGTVLTSCYSIYHLWSYPNFTGYAYAAYAALFTVGEVIFAYCFIGAFNRPT